MLLRINLEALTQVYILPEYSLIEVPEGCGSQVDVTSILLTRDSFLSKDDLTDLSHEIAHRWDVPAADPLPPRFESEGRAREKEFLDTLASFHRKYSPTGATTEDFLVHLRQNLKIDLTKLLQDWVYEATSSDYLINKIPIDQIAKKYLQTGGRSPRGHS